MAFCLGACLYGTVQALSHWWRTGKAPAGDCDPSVGCGIVKCLGTVVVRAFLNRA